MTNDKWYTKIIGARTIKTGLATFLTAFFCMSLHLNPIYATLSAIVTIEPTAKASLKKGYKRLPATVIGALLAVLFTYIFSDKSALAYAFSATCTIFICAKLKLHDGITVATLTAMAMIPGIGDAYFFNFFSRLLTAVIGLVTAGLVNLVILPPKYYNQVEESALQTEKDMYQLYSERLHELVIGKFHSTQSNKKIEKLLTKSMHVETLIRYQKDELSYHKHKEYWVLLKALTNRAHIDRLFITHLSNIIYLPKDTFVVFNSEERAAILKIAKSISEIIATGYFEREEAEARLLKASVTHLDEFDKEQLKSHLIYEILLTYRILDNRYA